MGQNINSGRSIYAKDYALHASMNKPTVFQIIGKITDITVYFNVQYNLCLCSANYSVEHKRKSTKFVRIL